MFTFNLSQIKEDNHAKSPETSWKRSKFVDFDAF